MAQHGSSVHELTNLDATDWQHEDGTQQAQQSVPLADRGRKAYSFLAACFMLEALVWGFLFAFGVFNTLCVPRALRGRKRNRQHWNHAIGSHVFRCAIRIDCYAALAVVPTAACGLRLAGLR